MMYEPGDLAFIANARDHQRPRAWFIVSITHERDAVGGRYDKLTYIYFDEKYFMLASGSNWDERDMDQFEFFIRPGTLRREHGHR